jgi:pyridoxal phosphate enzyme (YggS family)
MIAENIKNIKSQLWNTRLVAVSKTKPNSLIQEAYDAGQVIFGENKVQELCDKYETLPKDIEWHMIGHLQSNKVKYIAPFVYMVHGVDSLKLAEEINKQALKNNRTIRCLFQMHIADEETKFGFGTAELEELLQAGKPQKLTGIQWCGVMGMATFTDDNEKIRKEFKHLYQIFSKIRLEHFNNENTFSEISMGMSGDWQIAVEEGSTLIRVGSAIFGGR